MSRWFGANDGMTNIIAGQMAPNFSLKSLDGKSYSLTALLEKGLVVAAFFKVSCPVCQFTFPFLERIHRRYADESVTILGISQDDTRDTKEFCREYDITFPVVTDGKGYPVSNAYGLTNVPTVFLIEHGGKVRMRSMGFNKKDLETISAELAERRTIAAAPLFRPDEVIPAEKPG